MFTYTQLLPQLFRSLRARRSAVPLLAILIVASGCGGTDYVSDDGNYVIRVRVHNDKVRLLWHLNEANHTSVRLLGEDPTRCEIFDAKNWDCTSPAYTDYSCPPVEGKPEDTCERFTMIDGRLTWFYLGQPIEFHTRRSLFPRRQSEPSDTFETRRGAATLRTPA